MCTGRLSAGVKISLILFLLGIWAVPAPLATAQDQTLTGWFSMTIADQIEAAKSCPWSATSNSEWIRITSSRRVSGSGSVSYSVTTNPKDTARTGTLHIDGWTFTVTQAGTADVLFEDDMENGVNGWTEQACALDGCANVPSWALTTASSRSGTHAWAVRPGGNDRDDLWIDLFSPVIDLTDVTSATLAFWQRSGFSSGDAGRVRVRPENGDWHTLETFIDPIPDWEQVSIDLTPFSGQSIQLNFNLVSEFGLMADAWYIDDVAVFSSDFDTAPAPDPDYCRDYGPCGVGQGDCDPGQCAAGLVCATDVGPQYGLPAIYDVCELPEGSSTPDLHLCRDYGPCGVGQGDCDPGQCAAGLVCAADVGPQYGLPAIYDVCEVPRG